MLVSSKLWRALPLLAVVASPVEARNWASAGGWDIAEVDSDTCGMALEYEGEGETLLGLWLSRDGSVLMSVTNYGWSSTPEKIYDLVYFLNKTAYVGGHSVGFQSGIRKGFVTKFDPDFLNHFAASSYLTIESKRGVTIDDLKLDGSAAGLAQVRRCLAHLNALAATEAREKARFAHIPPDPFKEVSGGSPPAAHPAKPRAALASLVGQSDYPAAAMANREQGSVQFRLAVGTNGRVTGCTVLLSSGSSILDSATCLLMTSRAAFTPARSSSGTPVEGTFEDNITWRL